MLPEKDKKEIVRAMFNDISPKYDFLNHFLSFGIDRLWRKKLVKLLRQSKPSEILDVATGTGDLALAVAKINPRKIIGIDISEQMLDIGRAKLIKPGLGKLISFQQADAEQIPFPDNSFDAITVAFGVRNFENLELGISEMRRVLRPGGWMYILEFSHPQLFYIRQLYYLYSRFFIPSVGRLISGNNQAYSYLPESVTAFPSGQKLVEIIEKQGLSRVSFIPLSMGIASIYYGQK
ncbi:MAG: bifunctional demethylmenaquinone methyltransferase/2-methoxy-6-polyprenyl-1,4-benzoquinol methylase UbiE [Bacteroidetes bacterium]|nr:bifunctional demethylmenaquinone methyltransferase/2-methoxy-6-polyprenyl-1,4-benzoquinol methylase UbiE [Bacteroidota bacterium]